jgi:hypothetical protein
MDSSQFFGFFPPFRQQLRPAKYMSPVGILVNPAAGMGIAETGWQTIFR